MPFIDITKVKGMHGKITTLAALAVLSTGSVAQELVVRIGHAAPVSGAYAFYGKDSENGARMAIEDLNAKGVTIGGKKAKFELVTEDDAGDPKQATAVAQKLCDTRVNGVVGHVTSGATIPASRVYNDCGIPHITPGATNPKLTQNGYKTTFRLLASDDYVGAGVAVAAVDTLKLKRIAVVDDRTAQGQGVAEIFKKTALAKGAQIVSQQYTSDKATDFTSLLTAIKAEKPEALFYGGADQQAGPLLRQMEQLGLSNVRVLGGDGICTGKLAELASGAKTLNQVVCAEGGASIEKMPGGKAWKARYDKAYPGQFQIYSPYAYDAVMVLADAMARAGSSDPKVYGPKLFDADYKGVTSVVQFQADGELKNSSVTLFVFKDGKKVAFD